MLAVRPLDAQHDRTRVFAEAEGADREVLWNRSCHVSLFGFPFNCETAQSTLVRLALVSVGACWFVLLVLL